MHIPMKALHILMVVGLLLPYVAVEGDVQLQYNSYTFRRKSIWGRKYNNKVYNNFDFYRY